MRILWILLVLLLYGLLLLAGCLDQFLVFHHSAVPEPAREGGSDAIVAG